MIDFSNLNGVKAPVVPTLQPGAGTDVSSPFLADPNEIVVTRPAAVEAIQAPDYVMPSAKIETLDNPILSQLTPVDPIMAPVPSQRQAIGPSGGESNPSGQSSGGIGGMLGRLILGGSGDESSLSQEEQREKQGKRKAAGNASASFANDPESAAAGFMQAPGTGGGSLGDTIGKIFKMVSGLGIG